ncbi:MAG: OmpH family outer membrane protein [Geminicoccaceae bacterium]
MFKSRKYRAALIIVLLLAGIGSGTRAFAANDEQLPETIAAVIDYQRILQESSASQSIAEQMEVRRKTYQEEISKEEQKLYEAETALSKQRSVLSEDAFKSKQGEFEAKLAGVRELTQQRRQQLEAVSAEAANAVKQALIEILTGIAEERGFNLVLPTSQVLFFSRQIDLTDDVLAQLDALLPQVPIEDKVD